MRARSAIALLALAMAGVVPAQDQREAEQRLQKVRSELKAVASERRQLEGARGDANRKLREADQQVGGAQRALRQTQTTLQRDTATLAQLQAERAKHAGDLDATKADLARLLRDRLEQVLSGNLRTNQCAAVLQLDLDEATSDWPIRGAAAFLIRGACLRAALPALPRTCT